MINLINIHCTCLKKTIPFYFCDNFVGHEPMLIIFGQNVAKEIGNIQCLLLTVQCLTVENQLNFLNVAGVAENTWCSTLKIAF